MEAELLIILKEFGVSALWAVVIYQFMDWLGGLSLLCLIGYGIKRAWPAIKEFHRSTGQSR